MSGGERAGRVLISVPWTWAFGEPDADAAGGRAVEVLPRGNDWGLTRRRAGLLLLRDAGRLARYARRAETVILCTIGVEGGLMAMLTKLLAPRSRVVVFDFLAPRRDLPHLVSLFLFRPISRFLVIRQGDITMLGRRFDVPSDRVSFLRWPVREDLFDVVTAEDGYLYAAGWAHRDWDTLLAALGTVDLPARLAPGHPVSVPESAESRVEVVEMPSPDEGRRMAARASLIAVVMEDTDLPSGPLVLLDALAMGKAVVATDVNGTRDYVTDGETALVVPPGDPEALQAALVRLSSEPDLRRALGQRARTTARSENGVSVFWKGLLDSCH